ncbi:HupE/UreJ family protein [Luteolibacter sp. Populi]|uniref:HupE/UreJ family protein n=1 Tax=Luteolibacter sp. Populi TaxID=3230487 RepID=UPI003466BC13
MPRLLLFLLLLLPTLLQAHQIAEIPLNLEITGNQIHGTIEADAAYMLPEFRGDEQTDPKDLAWLRQQGPDGWKKIEEATRQYLKECLRLEADGKEVTWTLTIPELHLNPPTFMTMGEPEELPMLEAVIEAELPPGASKLDASWREPFDVVLVATVRQGQKASMKPLVSGERMTIAEFEHSAATADKPATSEMKAPDNSLLHWIKLGFGHILPKGFDHILFVLGLFLLAPKWKPLLQQTLSFTLAHSVSLALAALGWINVSSPETRAWIEILVCASIAWVGIENLLVKELGKGRIALVGAFGLVHGLGFATGLPQNQPKEIPAALFGFNVGVELAQVVVVLISFALFGWWKGDFKWIKRIGSAAIALVGLGLMVRGLMRVI